MKYFREINQETSVLWLILMKPWSRNLTVLH